MPVELKGEPQEVSQQLIQLLQDKGVLSPSSHLLDPRVPENPLTLKIAKTHEHTVP